MFGVSTICSDHIGEEHESPGNLTAIEAGEFHRRRVGTTEDIA